MRLRWWVPAACLLVAVTSWLLCPSAVDYDPTAWAVWGREVAHGTLVIGAGDPVFKPLPVAVDAVVALAHAPVLAAWAVLVRVAGVAAVGLAFDVGRRAAGALAGTCAAAALVAMPSFLTVYAAGAAAEPLEMAAVLGAARSVQRRRPVATFGWLTVLATLRPEAWPLLLAVGGWLVWRRRLATAWTVPAVAVATGSWFAGEYAGSGRLTSGVTRAAQPTQGGPLLTSHPALAVVQEAFRSLPAGWWLAAAAALAGTCWLTLRRHDRRAVIALVLAATAVQWLATVAVMTRLHVSSGDPRYLVVTTACGAVLAGLALGAALGGLAALLRARPLVAVAAAVVVAYAAQASWTQVELARPVLARRYDEAVSLPRVLDGLPRLQAQACPRLATGAYQVPLLAWDLRRSLPSVDQLPPAGAALWVVPATVRPPRSVVDRLDYRGRYWWVAGCTPRLAGRAKVRVAAGDWTAAPARRRRGPAARRQ